MKWFGQSASLALLLLASACSLAPDYHRPEVKSPASFKEAQGWTLARPADAAPRGDWWKAFFDPDLDALEARFGSGNEDLKIALARYEEARALATAARASYFPQVTGSATPQRDRNSETIANPRLVPLYNDYSFGADFSYELDLWGKVRNEVSAAGNRAEAGKELAASVDLSLRAELAQDYFLLRGDDASQIVLDQTVAAYAKALRLTTERYKGGVTAEADLDQAQAQYNNTRTQAADMRLKRAGLEHAIAVLVGENPSGFSIAPQISDAVPFEVEPGIASTLLERRPDIASAERLVMAANADIGVARAAWFPDLSLTGMLGYESESFSRLVTAPSQFWSLGPSVGLTLFDAGRIAALSRQARAAYDEQAASYRKTVLSAYQEVEDAIVAVRQLDSETGTQRDASAAADRALMQEQYRYSGGLVTYLDVVVTQNTALQTKLALIDVMTRQLTANIQLVKALGGGWEDD